MVGEQTRFPGFSSGELPEAANDNGGVAAEWQTHAEALQWVQQRQARMLREVLASPERWAEPEHRLMRSIYREMEKCARWQYYRHR